jgi:hypothetical protein
LKRFERLKQAKQSVRVYSEEPEQNEAYSKWFNPDDEDVYFSMNSRHRSCYRHGDQLFNSYGLRTNRFLILNYGFAIRQNKYNSLGFKVFVNYTSDDKQEMRHVKILKLKKNKLSEPLLQYLRVNLVSSFRT